MSGRVRVSCLQLRPLPETADGERYLESVLGQIRDAAGDGADLVVLPELWYPGYFAFDGYAAAATTPSGPLPTRLARLAGTLGITLHIGSLVEAGATGADGRPRLHNTSLVFGPDGAPLAGYRKVHVFGYASREPELIAGGRATATFPLAGARMGLAICYDLRFPELFRAVVDEVSGYVVPATWPAARVEHWSALLRARAIEDQAFVIGCNAAGTSHGVELGGHSAVIDPWGAVVGAAGSEPGRLDVEIDLGVATAARATFPALRDRVWTQPIPAAGSDQTSPDAGPTRKEGAK
ncbi:carbon-nitrogen family hydrolase [Rugosimonospora acidiphila]|uniref:Carbon-nitrogen family hydrolase n=1 Tax=Rugosimonospora acidiphila TaxID=556531 RepID=A0ABP9RSD0_9ACTN